MRRRTCIAVMMVLLLALPSLAQRGGHGGGMGGGHTAGGMSGGHAGGGMSHGSGGWGHSGSGWGWSGSGSGWHGRYSGYSRYYRYGWGYYPWGYGYYGYGAPLVGYGFWDTSPWYQSYDSYAYAPPANTYAYASPDGGASATYQQQQIDQLNQEVASLRAQQNAAAQNYVTRPSPAAQVHAETVLVFRDRHKEEVTNYAIVGKTLWIFSEQRARRIPISELDVPATTQANDDRGIVFSLPKQ